MSQRTLARPSSPQPCLPFFTLLAVVGAGAALALAALARGDLDAGTELGRELTRAADRDGDHVARVEGAYVSGVMAFWKGDLSARVFRRRYGITRAAFAGGDSSDVEYCRSVADQMKPRVSHCLTRGY